MELVDEVAGLAVFLYVLVVVVGSEIVEAGGWVGKEMPADHENGACDRDERFLFPASPHEAR